MAGVEDLWAAFLAALADVVRPAETYSAWRFCANQADADEFADLSGRLRRER